MIPLSLRFAARELRAGVRGFRIFLACLALGVAALAAAGSTAEAFRQGLASQARSILGGDVAVSVQGRRFSGAEQAAFTQVLNGFQTQYGVTPTYASKGDQLPTVLGSAIAGGSPPDVAVLPQPGLLHDLGHFALSDRVAERGRTLTDEDWVAIQRHPELGADMLKDLGIVEDMARELGLPLSGVAAAKRYFQDNKANGEVDLGTQAMFKAVERAIEKGKNRRTLSS